MKDPAKNILIGLFVASASLIVVFVLLFLHPTVGDDGQYLRVRFADIDKISIGTRVTYGGKPVGEVVAIHEIDHGKNPRKPQKDNFVYIYELVLGVDSRVNVYNTDEIVSRTSGLLGEKSVEISPMPAKPGETVRLVNKEILYANESGSVEEALKDFRQLADKVEGTLDSFKFAIDELNRNKIIDKVTTITQNLSDITTALNQPAQWTNTLNQMESMTKRIDGAAETINQVAENTQFITKNIKEGRGTLGQIIMKETLYLNALSLMNKAETILDDMNHYGLLFQNDKRWQRLRARRANLLTQLASPQEFRNYFNDELNEITTSLARVSSVLQETECNDDYQAYMDDLEFRKVFAELVRRVGRMEESLKLYNQQVVDRDVQETELNYGY